MSDKNMNKIEELKRELADFLKQKDNLFADYMRIEGIIAYVNAQLDRLDPDWRKKDEEAFLAKQKNTPQIQPQQKETASNTKEKKVYGN
jgi:hypothetical protein